MAEAEAAATLRRLDASVRQLLARLHGNAPPPPPFRVMEGYLRWRPRSSNR